MRQYDHKKVEKKWRQQWKDSAIYRVDESSEKPKAYVLDMFPYPSGEGLHVGHPKGYIATDVYSRFKRMSGFNVLHPMGWDAFGLPAENYAIKTKTHPRVAVDKNVARYKKQLEILGFDYDWDREINTTDPEYYKWTQWIFLKLFEKGLAYQSHAPINWCPSCQTGLANEDLESDGTCERCGSKVEQRPMRQWVLKITDYADRLIDDLALLPKWPEYIKEQQRNWIGRSEGAEIDFELTFAKPEYNEYRGPNGEKARITVFTTRPDTLFGATFLVLAPEHLWVTLAIDEDHVGVLENRDEVIAYVTEACGKTDLMRQENKEKTGVELKGVKAINPATKEEIPIFIADYVLAGYGSGAIMAVPAHDDRDFEFAKKFSVPIRTVISAQHITHAGALLEVADKPGQLILQKRDNKQGVTSPGKIGLFGGKIEKDDVDAVSAMRRELTEELGLPSTLPISDTTVVTHTIPDGRHVIFVSHITGVNPEALVCTEGSLISLSVEEALAHPDVVDHLKEAIRALVYRERTPVTDQGILAYSGHFSGQKSEDAQKAITEYVGGRTTKTYRLQDWVFSRQRYWGEPIPIIHCEKCGAVGVPEKDLPVKLPEVEHYEPTGTGESPLATIDEWVNTTCPQCGGEAKRETNTMPQWAGSSWYWLRFMDPHNTAAMVSPEKETYWSPVDVYVGGDHAVRHLIYARFWHKFLYDIQAVSGEEPFPRLEFLGFILAEDGRKMSKRWGNVINPDDVVERVGADSFRVYEMFMGPFENTVAWSTDSLVGARRFIERVWRLSERIQDTPVADIEMELHRTIKKVSEDIEMFKFNTAVAQMMIFINSAEKAGAIGKDQFTAFLRVLAPFAPHVTEELWAEIGNTGSIHTAAWPQFDPEKLVSNVITIAIQVNGKTRTTIEVAATAHETAIRPLAEEAAQKWLVGKSIHRAIYVPGRLMNLVVAE